MKYFLASLLSTSVMLCVFLLFFAAITLRFVLEELLCKNQDGRN